VASSVKTKPVEDTVPKIGNELAVGEDLEFQRRWWRFERIVWTIFLLILVADLAGLLGRGPLSKTHAKTHQGSVTIEYECIQRFSTPSMLIIHFTPAAVHDGKIQLWVSSSIIKSLGNQRVIPQPATSVISQDGVLYTWPADNHPDSAQFALEPMKPGMQDFALRLPAIGDEMSARVFVMP
jgi:hypothetical protein